MAGLKEAVEDVKRHQRGEIQLQSWDELYAELTAEQEAEAQSATVAHNLPA